VEIISACSENHVKPTNTLCTKTQMLHCASNWYKW